jgi:hypothetical protein
MCVVARGGFQLPFQSELAGALRIESLPGRRGGGEKDDSSFSESKE